MSETVYHNLKNKLSIIPKTSPVFSLFSIVFPFEFKIFALPFIIIIKLTIGWPRLIIASL